MDWCGTYSKDDAISRNQVDPADTGKVTSPAEEESSNLPYVDPYQESRRGYGYGDEYGNDANSEGYNADPNGETASQEASAAAEDTGLDQPYDESNTMESAAAQAPDNTEPAEDQTDYYRYKYGHFRGYYGENMDAPESFNESRPATDSDNATENASPTEDEEPSSLDDYNAKYGTDYLTPQSDEDTSMTDPSQPTNDESNKSDQGDNESNNDEPAKNDSTSSSTGTESGDYYGDYYRYKYGHLQGYYGENLDAGESAGESKEDAEKTDSTNTDESAQADSEVAPMTESNEPTDSTDAESAEANYDRGDESYTAPAVDDHSGYIYGETDYRYGQEMRDTPAEAADPTEPVESNFDLPERNYDEMETPAESTRDSIDSDDPESQGPSSQDESYDSNEGLRTTILSAMVTWVNHSIETFGQRVQNISRQVSEMDWDIPFLGSRILDIPVR